MGGGGWWWVVVGGGGWWWVVVGGGGWWWMLVCGAGWCCNRRNLPPPHFPPFLVLLLRLLRLPLKQPRLQRGTGLFC